jgi:hypothetical protein
MVFKNSPRYRLEYAHNSHDDAPHRRPQRYTGPPVTLDHIRSHGCRRLLIYCNAPGCHHSANIDADRWPDATVLRDMDRRAVCGMTGAGRATRLVAGVPAASGDRREGEGSRSWGPRLGSGRGLGGTSRSHSAN